MLEYPQIPQYIVWTQTKPITSECGDVGYKYLYGNGTNYNFGGLHIFNAYRGAYLSGYYQCGNWNYAIGTIVDQYNKHFPGFGDQQGTNSVQFVQYVDLWIELSDLNAINQLKPRNCRCTHYTHYSSYIKSLFIYVFILIEDS